jgi:hypothetical protein
MGAEAQQMEGVRQTVDHRGSAACLHAVQGRKGPYHEARVGAQMRPVRSPLKQFCRGSLSFGTKVGVE